MPNPFRRPPAARFVCAGCGLSLARRYAAQADVPSPLRCLRCAFLLTIGDARTREALRSLLARAEPGGRGKPFADRRRPVKVYLDEGGDKRLIGRADVPADCGPVFEVPLFGAASVIVEKFTIGAVTHLPEGGGAPVVERAVLAAPGQLVELLPGWEPLAS